MIEQEIKDWLGFGGIANRLAPEIIEGMRLIPVPHTDAEHIAAFRAWLKVAGRPNERVIFV